MKSTFLDSIRRRAGYRFPPLGRVVHDTFFKVVTGKVETELFPGIRIELDLNDLTQRGTYWQGDRFEFPTPQVLAAWCAEAKCFFDIGSNYGFFSYWILSRRKGIDVHAFEPNPRTYRLVERIKADNQLATLHPHNVGLSEEEGRLDLHFGIEDSGHSTFGAHPDLQTDSTESVRLTSFSNWLVQNDIALPTEPQWVAKIDVEGFELKVLRGMAFALQRRAFRGICVEINEFTLEFCKTTPADIFAFMDAHGYVLMGRVGQFAGLPLHATANAFFVPRPQ